MLCWNMEIEPQPDLLDLVELNELKTGEEAKFIEFLTGISISKADLEQFPQNIPITDDLNRLLTAYNLGIATGHGVKNSLICIGTSFPGFEPPADYSPSGVTRGQSLLEHLDLIVLLIAVAKVKAVSDL